MPLDPRTLAAIANPTGGKLGDIGRTYVKTKLAYEDNQRADEKLEIARDKVIADEQQQDIENDYKRKDSKRKDEKRAEDKMASELSMKASLLEYDDDKKKDNHSDATIIAKWIDRFAEDTKTRPEIATDPAAYKEYLSQNLQGIDDKDVLNILNNKSPSDFRNVRKNAQFAIDTYADADGDESFSDFALIPGTKLYGQRSSKNGKFVNIKDSIDGQTSLGSSEFERHIGSLLNRKLITQKDADKLIKQRAEGFAGELDKGEAARLDEKQSDRYNKETKQLREEYTKGTAHFSKIGITIEGAIAAMDSGNTKLSETLLNVNMLDLQDTSVRAFALYGEFDKEFGNLAQRIQGKVSRFLSGTRTQTETEEIRNVLKNFNESYVQPAEAKLRNRYRELAIRQGKKPFDVVPPKNPEDIKASTIIDKKEKIKMIKDFFPDWKPK